MKAITIRQPHLARLLDGTKPAEFRTWSTPYRGPIALHAARNADDGATLDMPRGAIVATARLIDVIPLSRTNVTQFSTDVERANAGEYAWIFTDVHVLDQPVACGGQLGLWQWTAPDDARQTRLF